MKIKLVLEPVQSVNWPKVRFEVNKNIIFDDYCKPNEGKYFVWNVYLENLKDNNEIIVTHYDKKQSDTIIDDEGNIEKDRAIMLKSLEFDGEPVPEVILYDQKFYPDWPDTPDYIKNNLYFGFNGYYVYNFPKNVQSMYYNNLLSKEMIANINNKKIINLPSGEQVESFEFNGKLTQADAKESVTIDELYERINEN